MQNFQANIVLSNNNATKLFKAAPSNAQFCNWYQTDTMEQYMALSELVSVLYTHIKY